MGEDIKVRVTELRLHGSQGEDELRYRCNGVAPAALLGTQGPGQ